MAVFLHAFLLCFCFQFGALLLVAAASAAPQFINQQPQFVSPPLQPEVRIVSQKFDQDQIGNYEYAYQQDNGQQVNTFAQSSK